MRISDWSSDVCSSDLRDELAANVARPRERRRGARQQHFALGRERVRRLAQHVGEVEIEALPERVVGGDEAVDLRLAYAADFGRDPRPRLAERGVEIDRLRLFYIGRASCREKRCQ